MFPIYLFLAAIFISGLFAILSSIAFGLFCLLSVIQIAMISSREKVVMSYTSLVMTKMVFALIGGKSLISNSDKCYKIIKIIFFFRNFGLGGHCYICCTNWWIWEIWFSCITRNIVLFTGRNIQILYKLPS